MPHNIPLTRSPALVYLTVDFLLSQEQKKRFGCKCCHSTSACLPEFQMESYFPVAYILLYLNFVSSNHNDNRERTFGTVSLILKTYIVGKLENEMQGSSFTHVVHQFVIQGGCRSGQQNLLIYQ